MSNAPIWAACKRAATVFYRVRQTFYENGSIHPDMAKPKIEATVKKAVARYGQEVEVPLSSLLSPSLKTTPYGLDDIAYEIWRHLPYNMRYTPDDVKGLQKMHAFDKQSGIDSIMDEEVPGYEIMFDPKFLAWIQIEAALSESRAKAIIDQLVSNLPAK